MMSEQNNTATVRWEWLGEAWQLFSAQWVNWVLISLASIVCSMVVIVPVYALMFGIMVGTDASEGPPAAIIGVYPLLYGGIALTYAFLSGGIFRAAFKQMRGQSFGVGDLFSGTDCFVRMLGAVVMVGILYLIGSIFCILPAFIAIGLFFLAFPMIAEQNISPMEAMRRSFEATKGQWLMFALFGFVLTFLAGIGALACFVGVLATYPWAYLTVAVAYRDVFGLTGATSVAPYGAADQAYAPQAYNQQSWANQAGQQPPVRPQSPAPYAPQPQSYAPPNPVAPPSAPAERPPVMRTNAVESLPVPPSITPAAAKPVASGAQADQRVCPYCQAVLARAANFCNYCGQPLQSER